MAKSKPSRKRKPKKSNPTPKIQTLQLPTVTSNKPLFKRTWFIILSVFTILGGITGIPYLWNLTKSTHDKFKEEKYIAGIIIPFNSNSKEITLSYGSSGSFTEEIPENGIIIDKDNNPFAGAVNANYQVDESAFTYSLKAVNGIFEISIIIKDLKTGEIIAQLEDNKFLINKISVNDYYSDNQALEIKDKYGNVAFQMFVDKKGVVNIHGYFYGTFSTVFVGDVITYLYHNSPTYQDDANKSAAELQPLFLTKL